MKYFKKFVVVGVFASLFCFMFPAVSYAYLDPGTGSYLLQIVIALFAGTIIFVRIYWNKIKIIFTNIHSKHKKRKNKS